MELILLNSIPFIIAIALTFSNIVSYIPNTVRTWLMSGSMVFLFVSFLSFFPDVQANGAIIQSLEWVPELNLSLSFYLDGISLIFALIITGIGAGIVLYAGYYFEDPEEARRFHLFLMAFAGAMLGVVIAGNLITLFIMWEMTSITSFMLIGFKGAKYADARFGAMQAFYVTGFGALALILGLVMLAFVSGEVSGQGGFVFDIATIMSLSPEDMGAHMIYVPMLIFLGLGAFTKSAQFPFHFWLPGAMAAPTPASAYLHSATMVKAGLFLMLRFYTPLHDNYFWEVLLISVGTITFVMGAMFAVNKRDLKGLLAYSTVSMLGGIMALIGLPDYLGIKAALVTIIAHALYKAALFLVVGTIDHNTGTRIIDKLGGMSKYMPVMTGVVIVSALSMAGLFPLFGFAAKEVLLDAFYLYGNPAGGLVLSGFVFGATLTVVAAWIVIYDVFFKAPTEEIHYHSSSIFMGAMPVILAIGTVTFGFLIPQLIEPLVQSAIKKEISLYLLPPEFWTIIPFWLSTGAIIGGTMLYLVRDRWMNMFDLPITPATKTYERIVAGIDAVGDFVKQSQNGQLRYYLIVILGVVATVVLGAGQISTLIDLDSGQLEFFQNTTSDSLLKGVLLLLIIFASLYATMTKRHITAVLALGVMGYAVGGIFLLEPAPDVAMVQLLVETLATILIVLILGRISATQREKVMDLLWKGRTVITWYDKSGNVEKENIRREFKNFGIFRDIFIATFVGITVFIFTLTAVINRPERNSIAEYHLNNTYEELGVTDVVGAIVADYRAMDTFIEIGVFAVAALGVLTLLSRGIRRESALTKEIAPDLVKDEVKTQTLEQVQDATQLSTPFTQMIARLVLPLTFLIALSHIINGSNAPGDGFTAGAISGLVVALWYVVFGYHEANQRLSIYAPDRMLRGGLLLGVVNAVLPIFLGGAFAEYFNYGEMIGIAGLLDTFGLKFTSTIIFEISIALTVFGGINAIMEAIAHPKRDDEELLTDLG